jgi:hypothetical protein
LSRGAQTNALSLTRPNLARAPRAARIQRQGARLAGASAEGSHCGGPLRHLRQRPAAMRAKTCTAAADRDPITKTKFSKPKWTIEYPTHLADVMPPRCASRRRIPCLPEHPSLVHFLFRTLPSDFIYLPASRRILEIIL